MILAATLALRLIILHTPEGRPIEVNPETIIAFRKPIEGHGAEKAQCVIATADGKFIAVQEDCDTVHVKLIEE